MLDLVQGQLELLHPQCRPLADSRGLGRLEVGESQGRKVLVFVGKIRQFGKHIDQFAPHEFQGLAHDDDISVVADVAAGGTQALGHCRP